MRAKLQILMAAAAVMVPIVLLAADAGRFVVLDHAAARAPLPFSDAVHVGNTLYVSGTVGVDPEHAVSDPAAEARLVLDAFKHTIEGSGFRMEDLVAVQVYCTDLDLYATFNEVYRGYFHEHFPARAFIGVNKLVRGARFEIMGTAVKGSGG